MNEDLKKIIESAFLIVHEGKFVCAKLKTAPPMDTHFLICKDTDEITVITRNENLEKLDLIEKSAHEKSLLEIQFSGTSDAPGFIAVVASALARQSISISVVSTYSKDYILVSDKDTKSAIQILTRLGLTR